jgi:hypothetical protein
LLQAEPDFGALTYYRYQLHLDLTNIGGSYFFICKFIVIQLQANIAIIPNLAATLN